jgi:hypothetical protein
MSEEFPVPEKSKFPNYIEQPLVDPLTLNKQLDVVIVKMGSPATASEVLEEAKKHGLRPLTREEFEAFEKSGAEVSGPVATIYEEKPEQEVENSGLAFAKEDPPISQS